MLKSIYEWWFLREATACSRCAVSGYSPPRRFVSVGGRPSIACLGCDDESPEADTHREAVENWNRKNRPILRGYNVVFAGNYACRVPRT